MKKQSLEAPVFFPSASRVKIPFVGDDTRDIQLWDPNLIPISDPLKKRQKNLGSQFVKKISNNLSFSKDVVKERCAHALPYDGDEVLAVYNSQGIVQLPSHSQSSGGRFDVRGSNRKVLNHFHKLASPRAAKLQLKGRTVTERHGDQPPALDTQKTPTSNQSHVIQKRIFITEPPPAALSPRIVPLSADTSGTQKQQRVSHWDEHILGKLSKDTARWIVFNNVSTGLQRDRLDSLMLKKYGDKISNTNLLREKGEDTDLDVLEKKEGEERRLARQERRERRRLEKERKLRTDRLLHQTFAQYYKLPRFLKQERSKVITVCDDVNQTAQNLKVKHLEPPPPPKMQDYLNPAAGKYIRSTENAFEQQLYTNQAKPVFQPNGDKSRIIMDDFSEYQSNIQTVYPPPHQDWSEGSGQNKNAKNVRPGKITKGIQRWRNLPRPADFASERGLNPPRSESSKPEALDYSHSAMLHNNPPLIHIIEQWRSKWKLAGKWQEVTLADIVIDLDNIHDHVRLGAVAACAMAALHKMPVSDIAAMAALPTGMTPAALVGESEKGHLPEVLIEKVRDCLNDRHKRVRLAAAMCLYTLSECNDDIVDILEYNLERGVPTDRMACAQCLALNGSTDAKVIQLLVRLLLETDQEEQATALLVHVSQNTRLVHSLLAEQLNSCNWKDKVTTCNVLSLLSGNINRDLVHKLSNLMWEDWSSEVRKAASRALGRTGHGRDVHFDLREKLSRGNERVRADVLRKIAHLGIMTATLLPEFLKCFSAEYVSVRLESCRTAAKLQLADDKVVAELLRITQFDPAWKIKAYAIKAITEIRVVDAKIRCALVWAMRFEDEPGVRLEACIAIRKLNCNTPDVVSVLQDRVLVEPDPAVKEEVRLTLDAFGMSGPEDNMEMIRQIKAEVRRLCSKSVVAAKVVMYEQELEKYERKALYIGDILDDISSGYESSGNEEEPEIANALRQSNTPDDQLRLSPMRPRTVALTPSLERPATIAGTFRTPIGTIAEEAPVPPMSARNFTPEEEENT